MPPSDLRFHIREAVEVARAKRIGHGVAIAYERDAAGLFRIMRERGVLVEICLTSNAVILGVAGAQHPFPHYLEAGVPVTLATDDEGVSRIDLTNEYLRAATTYRLRYRDLKQLARNSLTYSFLAGASLGSRRRPSTPCRRARPSRRAAGLRLRVRRFSTAATRHGCNGSWNGPSPTSRRWPGRADRRVSRRGTGA